MPLLPPGLGAAPLRVRLTVGCSSVSRLSERNHILVSSLASCTSLASASPTPASPSDATSTHAGSSHAPDSSATATIAANAAAGPW